MRTIVNTLGNDIVVVNATCCMEIVSSKYPQSAWRVPYIHSIFENGPAVASGVARALKSEGNDHTRVVYIGGDGGTYDIGMGAFSGALERNEDCIFICYDNNCYANTGVQRSSATPHFAATTTSPAGKKIHGKMEPRKHIGLIAAAHNIPYIAAASIGNLPDLKRKLLKAKGIRGASFILIHAPGPLEWRFDPAFTPKIARLAIDTGAAHLYEMENGSMTINVEPKFTPIEEYLKLQGRFKHLTPEEIAQIQKEVKMDWTALKVMEKVGKG
jgi:pyruvate ferredoxin oxidoreductase beta subunit